MLNIKKVVAIFCVAAMTITSMIIPASADNVYSVGLADGSTEFGGTSKKGFSTSVALTLDGLCRSDEDYDLFSAAKFSFYVTKDAFSSGVLKEIDNGAYWFENGVNSATMMVNVKAIDGNDKYDKLIVTFGGSGSFTTDTAFLWDVNLTYKAKSNFPAVELIPMDGLADDGTPNSYITLCDSNLNKIKTITEFEGFGTKYTIAGGETGTNKVVKEETPSVVPTTPEYVYNTDEPANTKWGDATYVGEFKGTADDKALAVKATVNPGQRVEDGKLVDNTYTGLVWKAVKADGKAVGYEHSIANITGDAEYVFGLVIDGASATDVQTNGFGIAVK